jgi:hypothetical protein
VPELVPIRYGRMLVSPFTFYRGGALIMANDLANTPNSGVRVQLCGDAHLPNFGVFGTPERQISFDINDFDETLPGPWEWDVKRLAASCEIMGRYRGYSRTDRRAIVMADVREYRERMREAAAERTLDVWYDHLEAGELLDEVGKEVRKGELSKKSGATLRRGWVELIDFAADFGQWTEIRAAMDFRILGFRVRPPGPVSLPASLRVAQTRRAEWRRVVCLGGLRSAALSHQLERGGLAPRTTSSQ